MPQISVIVPIYNVEKYLERCIESILKQTFLDFELILIDDGSPDRCGEICEEYAAKDPRIYVIHQKNGGLSAARNAGIDYVFSDSDSEWITFIDSDDWIHPEYLERLYAAVMQNNKEIAVCAHIITGDMPPQEEKNISPDVVEIAPEELFVNNRATAVIACAKMYKKSLFETIRYPVGRLHEDEFVTYRLLFGCPRLSFIPDGLYFYYQNPDGIMMQDKWDPRKSDAVEAMWEQCLFFDKEHYHNAETATAVLLFGYAAIALKELTEKTPSETARIKMTRKILRKAMKKYNTELHIGAPEYEKMCNRLAYPFKTELRNKQKRMIRKIRRNSDG